MTHNIHSKKKLVKKHTQVPIIFSYEDLPPSSKTQSSIYSEIDISMDDDIHAMRRHFKRTAKILARHIYYDDQIGGGELNEYGKFRLKQA